MSTPDPRNHLRIAGTPAELRAAAFAEAIFLALALRGSVPSPDPSEQSDAALHGAAADPGE